MARGARQSEPGAYLTPAELIAFEDEVAKAFEEKRIRGPIHLSGGNEARLISIFTRIKPDDWVFSTYRNHYHALLHGIPREWVMGEILAGRSMNMFNVEHRFFTSAIVGGTLSIAVGVAAAIKRAKASHRVWCFVGDMAATTGAFYEAHQYAVGRDLPVTFIVEDNRYSHFSPTAACWGDKGGFKAEVYEYERTRPPVGVEKWVAF